MYDYPPKHIHVYFSINFRNAVKPAIRTSRNLLRRDRKRKNVPNVRGVEFDYIILLNKFDGRRQYHVED